MPANHFIEWQADYHDEFNSHSLSCHLGPPASAERRTFYRAYIGADGGKDNNEIQLPVLEQEDQRATRLEAEVAVWEAASHAAWALWAVVQARDIILDKIDTWMHQRDNESETETTPTTPTEEKDRPRLHRSKSGELQDTSGRFNPELDPAKSGSKEEEIIAQEADFDYLRYALVSGFSSARAYHFLLLTTLSCTYRSASTCLETHASATGCPRTNIPPTPSALLERCSVSKKAHNDDQCTSLICFHYFRARECSMTGCST